MIIKICGILHKNTLLCCERNNVEFFGMVFYPKSPRNISIESAKNLLKISRSLKIKGVGVFYNKDISELENIIKVINLKFVQLHGSEDETYINKVKRNGCKVIKSISISKKDDLNKIDKYKSVDYFLFDYKPIEGELPGGNAKSFNWSLLQNLKINKPWFLSGGVNINNIQQINDVINPYGVDLSSGVEKELGIKDNRIINNFIRKLKDA